MEREKTKLKKTQTKDRVGGKDKEEKGGGLIYPLALNQIALFKSQEFIQSRSFYIDL